MKRSVRLPLALFVLAAAPQFGCGARSPATTPEAAATHVAPAAAPAAPAAEAPPAVEPTAAAKDEAARYSQRRVRKRAVIGGCEESCETPEKAMVALLSALEQPAGEARREALHALFDWSQVFEDGQSRGDRWADLWGDPAKQPERMREIEAFLDRFAAVVDGDQGAAVLARWKGGGVETRAVAERADLFEVALRMPAGVPGEPRWRLTLARRGWEWLVVEVEHEPGRRPAPLDRVAGNVAKGKL